LLVQRPADAPACYQLANLLLMQGNVMEGEKLLRTAIDEQPDFAPACHMLGQLLGGQGDIDGALEQLERARALQPGVDDIPASMAGLYIKAGQRDRALALIEPLLQRKPVSAGVVLAFAALAPALQRTQEAIGLLQSQLENTALPVPLRVQLHFALGKLYDSTEHYSAAFEQFRLGNDANTNEQAAQNSLAQLQVLREAFPGDAPAALRHASNTSGLPVFVVGMPRSGTTLVEQILSSHPQVCGAGELTFIGDLLNAFPAYFGRERVYPFAVAGLSVDELDRLADAYLGKLRACSADVLRITDKMPHNFLHLGLITQLFPSARVIYCARDPLDTCLSIYTHNFSANHPYASSLASLGSYYKAAAGLMEHWKSTLNIPIFTVVYEELVADQERVSRAMIDFCGLQWDPACLRFYETRRVVSTPSHEQVRKPLYTGSIGRWKHYREFLAPLIRALE
jgi:tetratricopeptide (TPR) repeat protein